MTTNLFSNKRCVLVLLDGLGDRAFPVLDNKTPLQAAHTPNLDRLAALGSNGLFHAHRPGRALPSENAHFAIFGYKPEEFPGRGLLEALGADIEVFPGEVALLAHFNCLATSDNVVKLVKNRPECSAEEAGELARAVASFSYEDISFRYMQTSRLDGILVLSGPVSSRIIDSDCFVENQALIEVIPERTADGKALRTARALKAYLLWCLKTLDNHQLNLARRDKGRPVINGLVTQRPGSWQKVTPFSRKWGLKGVSLSSSIMYWGLSRFLGLDVHGVKDSADPGEDLAQRLKWVISNRDKYSFFHVHTKRPDQAAHTKDPGLKKKVIEALDRGIGSQLEELLDDNTVVVVTADHSTPSGGPLVHSGEPVPLMVIGPGIRRDQVAAFDEISCCGGGLGQLVGSDFMPCVLNWLDRCKLQGLMDCETDWPYWPGPRRPFRIDRN